MHPRAFPWGTLRHRTLRCKVKRVPRRVRPRQTRVGQRKAQLAHRDQFSSRHIALCQCLGWGTDLVEALAGPDKRCAHIIVPTVHLMALPLTLTSFAWPTRLDRTQQRVRRQQMTRAVQPECAHSRSLACRVRHGLLVTAIPCHQALRAMEPFPDCCWP